MDWHDLNFVLAVSRAGTLSGAAKELGVVRTTVGRRLDALEDSLGVRLFDRTPDGFVPTAAGQDLTDVAVGIESEILAVQSRVSGLDVELLGRLRVATVDFLFEAYVDVFASFIHRYAGVELTVCASYETVSLRRREADVALRVSDRPPEHLVGNQLGTLEAGIYVHRKLVGIGEPDLNALPWIATDERNPDPADEAFLASVAPDARVTLRVDCYPVLRAAVRAGLGAHMLPCIDADKDHDLVRIVPEFSGQMSLWALTLPELRTNSRVRAFLDHIMEEMPRQLSG